MSQNFRSPSFELSLRKFIKDLKDKKSLEDAELKAAVRELVQQFISELRRTADIRVNEILLDEIIDTEDFKDLKRMLNENEIDEYIIRKHIRDIMKIFLHSAVASQELMIKDKTNFGLQLASLGLNIGLSTEREARSTNFSPDGNVVVLGLVTILVIALIAFKPRNH